MKINFPSILHLFLPPQARTSLSLAYETQRRLSQHHLVHMSAELGLNPQDQRRAGFSLNALTVISMAVIKEWRGYLGDMANIIALKGEANITGLAPKLSNLPNEPAVKLHSPKHLAAHFQQQSILTWLLPLSCYFFRFSIYSEWEFFWLNVAHNIRKSIKSCWPATQYQCCYFTRSTNKKEGCMSWRGTSTNS